jgi:tRNA nucleotidyltransferase (CCA-adding enzyme)
MYGGSMKKYLEKLPKEIRELIYFVKDLAAYYGVPAYLVGGFARDLLLGVKNFDLDIVVEGDGIKFAEYCAKLLKGKLVRHRRFGTATVVLKHGLKIDFASARSEVYPQPASLPVVKPSGLKDDLFRRDFTINAMAISLQEREFGNLIDFFGGKADLKSKKVRILHDLSFIDDPTRILRAVRFEQRYGFQIEPGTLAQIKDAVRLRMLEKVQPQRIRDDIILLLKEDDPVKVIRRLDKLSGFKFIDKHIKISREILVLLRAAQEEIRWYELAHPERRKLDKWLIYFIALTDSQSAASIKSIVRRFALKRGEGLRILSYKASILKVLPELKRKNISPSELSNLLEPLSYEVMLILKAKYKSRILKINVEKFFIYLNGMRIHTCGEDLRCLGLNPGPRYQKILKAILDAKLDGRVCTKVEELNLARNLINKG